MSADGAPRDYLDKARSWAMVGMVAAGALAVVGSFLDWVRIQPPPVVPEDQADAVEPYTGVEAVDGWYVIGAAVVLIAAGVLLYVRGRGSFAWLGFFAAMIIGAIAVADRRAVQDLDSAISQRMEVAGTIEPGIGLTVVALGGLAGLIASAVGVAATPRTRQNLARSA